jgi:hypothetical protein
VRGPPNHMVEFYTKDAEGDRKRVLEALERSPNEMRLWMHAEMMIDAGMSYYCLVCGARQQSLQPAATYTHRDECPLYEIGQNLPALCGDKVHIIHDGKVLCGLEVPTPGDWPEGHHCVGVLAAAQVTCWVCEEEWDGMK